MRTARVVRLAVLCGGVFYRPAASAAPHPLAKPIEWVTASVEYPAACRQAYAAAWDAVERAAPSAAGDWVVVLDVDDTAIQTWTYGQELVETDTAYTPESWKKWVLEGNASAVPGAKKFLDKTRALGPKAHVAFITDDTVEFEPAKVETMRRLGLFVEGDLILSKSGKGDDKEARRKCLRDGAPRCGRHGPLTPIVYVGDSIRDFVPVEGKAVAEALRKKIVDGGEWCPDRAACVILPNPVYGHWETGYSP